MPLTHFLQNASLVSETQAVNCKIKYEKVWWYSWAYLPSILLATRKKSPASSFALWIACAHPLSSSRTRWTRAPRGSRSAWAAGTGRAGCGTTGGGWRGGIWLRSRGLVATVRNVAARRVGAEAGCVAGTSKAYSCESLGEVSTFGFRGEGEPLARRARGCTNVCIRCSTGVHRRPGVLGNCLAYREVARVLVNYPQGTPYIFRSPVRS